MKRFAILALSAVCLVGMAQAVVITQWNFNSVPADGNLGTGTLTPSTGTGTATVVGGVTSSFSSANVDGGSSDPAGTGDDTAWQTTTYASTAPNNSAGIQGLTSTVGFEDIFVSFDSRQSATSSRFLQFQYTSDGSSWNNFGSPLSHTTANFWFLTDSFDLSSIAAVENNPNFGVRVVATFAPTGGYQGVSSTFASGGTIRYDMLTVSGTAQPVPEPASLAALGVGALALLRRRSKK